MKFKTISKKRGKKRQALLKMVSLNFIAVAKQKGKSYFTRNDFVSSLDCEQVNIRTIERITKEALSYLVRKGKIKQKKLQKKAVVYRVSQIGSQDFGSFDMLMRKNGYRKNREIRTIEDNPFNEFLALCEDREIHQSYMWGNSSKPRKNQGCYSFGSKSIRRVKIPYITIVYEIVA